MILRRVAKALLHHVLMHGMPIPPCTGILHRVLRLIGSSLFRYQWNLWRIFDMAVCVFAGQVKIRANKVTSGNNRVLIGVNLPNIDKFL